MRNRQQVAESFASAPTGTLLFYLASFFAAALLGAWVARLIARSKAIGWVAAGVMALMALVIAIFYPDPAWAQFGAFGAALLGGLIGSHLPGGRRAGRGDDHGRRATPERHCPAPAGSFESERQIMAKNPAT